MELALRLELTKAEAMARRLRNETWETAYSRMKRAESIKEKEEAITKAVVVTVLTAMGTTAFAAKNHTAIEAEVQRIVSTQHTSLTNVEPQEAVQLPEVELSEVAEAVEMVADKVTKAEAEAQVAEAQVAEAQVAEAQVAEVQVAEAQVAEAQVAEAQVAEAQVAEAQVAEAQVAEAQVAEAQVAEVQVAEAQVSEAQVAEAQVAKAQVAEAQVAEAQVAEAQVAEAQVAEAQVAEAQVAEVQVAEVQVAEAQVSESQVAEAQVAEAQVAEAQVAEAQVAEAQVAEVQVAEAQVAEAQVAETQAVESQAGIASSYYNMTLTASELDFLEKLVFSESGNQPDLGQILVANAVLNRAKVSGQSVVQVGCASGQFSPVKNGVPCVRRNGKWIPVTEEMLTGQLKSNVRKALEKDYSIELLQEVAMQKGITDPRYWEGGAKYFYNPNACSDEQNAARSSVKVEITIADHNFYAIWG